MRDYRVALMAILAATMPSIALADDPRDPEMQNTDARQRDAEMVRKLNRQESDRVRERDARYAQGRREGGSPSSGNANDYAKARADYERDHAQYERDMAKWRRATAACNAGDYSACRK